MEHAPVQTQDGNFGEEQTEGVEKLADEEQQLSFVQCIFQCHVLGSNDIGDVESKAVIDPLRIGSAIRSVLVDVKNLQQGIMMIQPTEMAWKN